ncbi:MAG: response regulator transcription factor [Proteobacteria bacterium]|jgi:two-component system alkaline phosphatase synthesis response regulator PhoP|nr:response regulator transcription factor [Pseudomonadota bacterium]MBK9251509.1 response regulator transcription factor [Pseudomonadota bacterium]MCC6633014.1 response regulator transcription factor [Gammaproteobacteria bacterium]
MDTPLLLVEDDTNVARTLTGRLASEGFGVTHAGSVAEAKSAIAQQRFVAAILDVGLPDGNGFEVARHLGEHSPQTAMLFLTAYGTPEDRIHGLELGADDYMTKPFAFRELVLRVQNMLKRARDISQSTAAPAGPVRIGIAQVDFARFTAHSGQSLHRLTHKECAVLQLLLEKSGKAVSRDEILSRAWAPDEFPTERTVDNFILRLRRLVEQDPANPQTIRSIRGVGYLLENNE